MDEKGGFCVEEKDLTLLLNAARSVAAEIGSRFGIRVVGYCSSDSGVVFVCEDLRSAVTSADMNAAEQVLRRICAPCRIDLVHKSVAPEMSAEI